MFTVRISQSDPHLFAGIDHALADPRIAGRDVYFHVEPGTYAVSGTITVRQHMMVVPTHGPGTVFLQSVQGPVFDVGAGHLELHGVSVRDVAADSPTVVVREQALLTARDCTVVSGGLLLAPGSRTDLANCGFQGAHLRMNGVYGQVRRCTFERSDLWLSYGGETVLDGLRFDGGGEKGPSLVVTGASPRVSDCRVAGGGSQTAPAVAVHGEAAPHFTDLEVVDSLGCAVLCSAGTAAEFARLRVRGGGWGDGAVFEAAGAVTIRGGEIVDTEGRAGLMAQSELWAFDLALRRAGENSLVLKGRGEGTVEGLRCDGYGQWAVRVQDEAALRLFDAVLLDAPEVSRHEGRKEVAGAMAVAGGTLEARSVTVDGAPGPALLGVQATMTVVGLSVSGDAGGLHAVQSTELTVDGARFDGTVCPGTGTEDLFGPLLACGTGARITADRVDAVGARARGVLADRGTVLLRSSRFEGCGSHGIHVLAGGVVEAVETRVADGVASGVLTDGPGASATLRNCTVTGNAGPATVEHPEAVITVEDSEVSGHGRADTESDPDPVEARLSRSDPNAYDDLQEIVAALGTGDEDLLVRVDPGTYRVGAMVSVHRAVSLTAAEGPGTVVLEADRSSVLEVLGTGRLDLYGITVRNWSREHALVRAEAGTGLRARDCVFVSNTPVKAHRARIDFSDCRFRGAGLDLDRASGAVHGCSFEYASVSVAGGNALEFEGLRFEGTSALGASITITGAAPRITDCAVDGGGDDDGTEAVRIAGDASPEFTGLSVVGSRAKAITCVGGARAVFSGLSVRGGDGGSAGVVSFQQSDVELRDAEIVGADGATGLWVDGGTLRVDGLTVDGAGDHGMCFESGARVHGEGLRCRGHAMNGIVLVDGAEAELSDTSVTHDPEARREGKRGRGAVLVLDASLTARALTVEGSASRALVVSQGRVSVAGLAVSSATEGVLALDSSHVELAGATFARITVPKEEPEATTPILLQASADGGIEAEGVEADGAVAHGIVAAGGRVRVRSSRFRGLAGAGFFVGRGGTLEAESTALQDGGGTAVRTERGAALTLRRCTVSGHQGPAFDEDPEAVVTVEDCEVTGNGSDPALGRVALRVSRTGPEAFAGPQEAVDAPEAEDRDVVLTVAPGVYRVDEPVQVYGSLRVVAEEGPGTVVFEAGAGNVFNVRGGHVDLRGITVRNTAEEYPPLYAHPGSRVTARHCTVESAVRVLVEDTDVELEGCRFSSGGLELIGAHGTVRGCSLVGAVVRVSDGGDLDLEGLRFEGAAAGLPNLWIDGASPRVSDCRVVGGGHEQGVAAVRVLGERGTASPVFTDLTVLHSGGPALWCRSNTRSEFTRLYVEGGTGSHGGEVGFVGAADAVIRDSEMVDTRGADGVFIEGGTVEAAGLSLRGAGERGLSVRGGAEVGLARFRCLAYAGWAVVCLDSTLELADAELIDVPEVSRAVQWGIDGAVGALEVVGSTLRVRGLEVEGSPGTAVSLVDSSATLIGVTVSGGLAGLRVDEDSRVTVREVRVTGLGVAGVDPGPEDRAGLSVSGRSEVWADRFEAVGLPEAGVLVRDGAFVAASSLLEGNSGAGLVVDQGGTVDLTDTAVRDNGRAGADVVRGAVLVMRGCTVEGNTGPQTKEHPGATVTVEADEASEEETEFSEETGEGEGSRPEPAESVAPDEPSEAADAGSAEGIEAPVPGTEDIEGAGAPPRSEEDAWRTDPDLDPLEVRVSWSDRSAYSGIREALEDLGLAGRAVRFLVDPGVYTVSEEVNGHVAVVPTRGPGTVALEMGEGNVFSVLRGHLELHGVTVRNTADDCPSVLMHGGTRFTARGCTFLSPSRVFVEEAEVAVEDCVFRGGGLRLDGSSGHVRRCRIEEGGLRVSGTGDVEVEELRIDSSEPVPGPGPLIWIEDASPHLRDCRVTGRGGRERTAVVVTGSREETAPTFSDLWIVDTGGQAGLTVRGGRLRASGLRLHGCGGRGLVLEDGAEAEVEGLRCSAYDDWAVFSTDGVLHLADAVLTEAREESRRSDRVLTSVSGALGAVDSTVEARDLAIEGAPGFAVVLERGRTRLTGVTVTGDAGGVQAGERAHLRLEDARMLDTGLRLPGGKDAGVSALSLAPGAEVVAEGLEVKGHGSEAVFVEEATLVLRSGTLRDNAGTGLFAPAGGTVEMADTVVCGNGHGGIALGETATLSVRGCTVTGNFGPGIGGHPGAVVEVVDSEVDDGIGGPGDEPREGGPHASS